MENRPAFDLLGPFKAKKSCGTGIDFGHRKALALLAYLAVENQRPHAREHLASLLWARTGEERARHNLRQALSKLRGLCPDLIQTPADRVSLNTRACSIDVVRFEAARNSADIGELETALALYRGDLLEGYAAREADFQDWLEAARARLRDQASDIARRLADRLIEQGRDAEAAGQLKRLLEFDPANENAHRDMMRVLARNGRRSDALRQYQVCRQALAKELDVEPAPETRRLLEEIRLGKLPGTAADAAPQAAGNPANGSDATETTLPAFAASGAADDNALLLQQAAAGPVAAQAALELPGKPSLLLKPFDNISNDAGQDYFAEGLTKDISIALTKIPGLFLALDETPRARASQGRSAAELGRMFGVRYLLCGGVRRHGERVRVNAELIDTGTGQCVWGERYDRELIDLFAIQDEITEEIVTAMDVKLVQGEAARFMRRSLADPSALEASYRGWYALYHGTGREDVLEAQRLFERVIELEPQAPLGYASAALAYWAEAGFGRVVIDSPAMQRAAELARKALELGDTTGYANLVLAVECLGRRDFDGALSQVSDGVAARPNCNGAYAIKSSILNFLGRPQEAIEFARYAVRLTPVYPAEFPAVLAACYHDCGHFEDAVKAAQTSLQLRDNDIDPMLMLTASQVALGQLDEARANAVRILQIDPRFRLSEFAVTQPYRDPEHLQRLIERLREAGLPD